MPKMWAICSFVLQYLGNEYISSSHHQVINRIWGIHFHSVVHILPTLKIKGFFSNFPIPFSRLELDIYPLLLHFPSLNTKQPFSPRLKCPGFPDPLYEYEGSPDNT